MMKLFKKGENDRGEKKKTDEKAVEEKKSFNNERQPVFST